MVLSLETNLATVESIADPQAFRRTFSYSDPRHMHAGISLRGLSFVDCAVDDQCNELMSIQIDS